jgi:hypothetical protein
MGARSVLMTMYLRLATGDLRKVALAVPGGRHSRKEGKTRPFAEGHAHGDVVSISNVTETSNREIVQQSIGAQHNR